MASHLYESEQALVAACAEGDAAAWQAFVTAYGRLIEATAAKVNLRGSAAADLDDLVAHVYEKLLDDGCRRLRAWQGRARFSTYLVQVVRNLALDFAERFQRGPAMTPLEERPEAPAPTPETDEEETMALQVKALRVALDRLPPRQAVIVRMRLEGASLRDIAALLKRPVGTVSVENSRALQRLRTLMEPMLAIQGIAPAREVR